MRATSTLLRERAATRVRDDVAVDLNVTSKNTVCLDSLYLLKVSLMEFPEEKKELKRS